MSALPSITAAELRGELAELRRKIDEIETRLETRLAAAERKQKSDHGDLKTQLARMAADVAGLERRLGDVASGQEANHIGLLHVLSVLMRYVKVPEKEIRTAMRTAGAGRA